MDHRIGWLSGIVAVLVDALPKRVSFEALMWTCSVEGFA